MPRKITLYPIHALAMAHEDEPFDLRLLPYQVHQGVALEDVTPLFNEETWNWVEHELGRWQIDELRGVRHAIVHRYENAENIRGGGADTSSEKLVRNLAALLRLIRPMRQTALLMQGELREDASLNVNYFEHPIDLLEVPQVQKLFHLRTQDAQTLTILAPSFLHAMAGEFWKFRMALEFHEAGHFQGGYWKARFTLWCSALEAIYTSQAPEHQGSNVARERIKWFLNPTTRVYPPGDIPHYFTQSNLTIQDVVADIYQIRNFVAHGEKIPDEYFNRKPRRGFQEDVNAVAVSLESASFIVRSSLLKILRDGLLDHFASAAASENYFTRAGLTNTAIRQRRSQQQP